MVHAGCVFVAGVHPSTGGSEKNRICDAAWHRTASPTHYWRSYSNPHWYGWNTDCHSQPDGAIPIPTGMAETLTVTHSQTRLVQGGHHWAVPDLPTRPYFTVLVRKSAGSTDVCPYFSKYGHRVLTEKIGTPVATLPGAWHYRVSTVTGWLGISVLWLGEVESLICNFSISVAARELVWANLSLAYTSMLLGH